MMSDSYEQLEAKVAHLERICDDQQHHITAAGYIIRDYLQGMHPEKKALDWLQGVENRERFRTADSQSLTMLKKVVIQLTKYFDSIESEHSINIPVPHFDKKVKLSGPQLAILQYLYKKQEFVPPTQIGREVGGSGRHSAWSCPKLKALCKKGLCQRSEAGHYKCTSKGEAYVESFLGAFVANQ